MSKTNQNPSQEQSNSFNENALDKVVILQTLCRIEQVFVYRVPPMKTSGGHRAEDWNLANPAATCSMQVLQRDNTLLLQLLGKRPKRDAVAPGATEDFLFAQAKIVFDLTLEEDKAHRPIEYWVEAVVDSSRYFVVRCEDEKSNRQAFVGIGFRERDQSMNFKMSMEDFWRAMEREKKALQLQIQHEEHDAADQPQSSASSASADSLEPAISHLSLKEGEKIHIKIKGAKGQARGERRKLDDHAVGTSGLLLRRPPPPGGTSASALEEVKRDYSDQPAETTTDTEGDLKRDQSTSEDSDEDWGDFEG